MLGVVDPMHAIVWTFEIGFGLVPMVYLFCDYHRTGQSCEDQAYGVRLFSSIPQILMTKQLSRTVAHLASEGAVTVWWHFIVDNAELFVYFVYGLCAATDQGVMWFLIFSTVPPLLSSCLLDAMLARLQASYQSNTRLMRTAFDAVVHVDRSGDGKVYESSDAFDLIVDGKAKGVDFRSLFTAGQEQLTKLCAASQDAQDSGRIVRRLRTTCISMSREFQQDVEIRALVGTEQEMSGESLPLGVMVMGERLPLEESGTTSPSMLLEQNLEEISQLRFARTAHLSCVPEDAPWDAASSVGDASESDFAGQRPVRRRRRGRSASTSSLLSWDSDRQLQSKIGQLESGRLADFRPAELCKELKTSYGDTWATPDPAYLMHCSTALLSDLVASWNISHSSCCNWHAVVNRLAAVVGEMRSSRACDGVWPDQEPAWQCDNCGGLQFEHLSGEACWLCCQPAGPGLEAC